MTPKGKISTPMRRVLDRLATGECLAAGRTGNPRQPHWGLFLTDRGRRVHFRTLYALAEGGYIVLEPAPKWLILTGQVWVLTELGKEEART